MISKRLGWVLAVGLITIGCSGTTGPKGDAGIPGAAVVVASIDPGGACSTGGASINSGAVTAYACNGRMGDAGPKGDPGMVGTSATVTALGTGSACMYGGTQVSDGVSTSLACNGAPGLKGDKGDPGIQGFTGPRLVLRTASGAAIGQAYPYYGSPYGLQPYVAVAYSTPPSMALVSVASGRLMANDFVFFSGPNCTGDAAMSATQYGVYAVEASGSSRVFAPVSTTPTPFAFVSAYQGSGCAGMSGITGLYPAAEVVGPSYPYATPFSLTFE